MLGPPPPPPAELILEKVEVEPCDPEGPFGPPPPTAIGKAVAVTDKPSAAKGLGPAEKHPDDVPSLNL